MTKTTHKNWHATEASEVLNIFESDQKKGFNRETVKNRLDEYGHNELPQGEKRSAWMRFIMQFHNVLIYVLIVAAVITALLGHWIDTWVIVAVVMINALIGFLQEGKAEKALEGIRQMLSLEAIVLRDGKKITIDAEDLVPGDIVLLKSGDKVPADMRLIRSKDLKVEESPLTGESTSVEKDTDPVEKEAIIGDRTCMSYSGTVVTYGEATGVVVATGANTEIGKINQMMSDVEKITTPLLQQIEKFGKWLSLIIILFTTLFFLFGYFFRDYSISELFLAAIGLIVAAIPEGLPAIMTITLAIGVQRMASRNAIIRHLPSVETLGAVDVICSDKTGTLTRNEMTAKKVVTTEEIYEIEGSGYEPKGNILKDGKTFDLAENNILWLLLQAARANNNAEITKNEQGNWELTGMPTEGALQTLSYKAGLQDFKPERIDIIPFESDHKYMATLNQVEDKKLIFMTGAPEQLIEMSHKQYSSKGEENIDKDFWEENIESIAAEGKRMLGIAFKEVKNEQKELKKAEQKNDYTMLGLVGIIDPPRQEVIEAIKACKSAGIQVKMITGDHAVTARAIGKEIGIGDGEKAITGKELEKKSDEELQEIVETHDIYARASPEHKLRLVTALQKNKHLCAMTGDGVNDAPALKKANIGIAMGIKGTEVSKDASEMVLADDNFASIVHAVEEGRTVYDNIRKALLFILPTNGSESLVLMAAILLGIVMPITPAQILWVNMVTAVTLALALSFEPMEEQVMERPPRKSGAAILGKYFIWRIIFVSFLIGGITLFIFNHIQSMGLEEGIARTIAINTLVAGQLFYLFNCRKIKLPSIGQGFFNNKVAFIAAGTLILLQIFFVYVPFMNTFFNTKPLEAYLWLYPVSAGALIFIIVELEKYIIRTIHDKKVYHTRT